MNKVTFRDLFDAELLQKEANKGKNTQHAVRGDLFIREPLPVDVEAIESAIVCFVSLSCASCIDLMPELNAFAKSYEGTFILVSSGTEEENKDLIRHFQYDFPVFTMSKEERFQKYASSTTPYAYFLEDGYVINTGVVDNTQELDALIGRIEKNEA